MKFLLLAFSILLVVSGCAESNSQPASTFWSGNSDVRGNDTLTSSSERGLPDLVNAADAVMSVEVTGIAEVRRAGLWSSPVYAEDDEGQKLLELSSEIGADVPLATVYSAKVQTSLRGLVDSEILITQAWGLMSDGTPVFDDGTFLLEPGREYLLLLYRNERGELQFPGWARWGFELTDGVKVMNHPDTRDLEHFEEMTVDEFIAYVKGLVTSESTGN